MQYGIFQSIGFFWLFVRLVYVRATVMVHCLTAEPRAVASFSLYIVQITPDLQIVRCLTSLYGSDGCSVSASNLGITKPFNLSFKNIKSNQLLRAGQ